MVNILGRVAASGSTEKLTTDHPSSLQMNRRRLDFRVEQQLGRYNAGTAIIEDPMVNLRLHGIGITMARIGSRIGATDTDKVNSQMAKLLLQLGIRTEIERPAIGEHPIDPAFEQRWHRPPINRINQHQRIGAINPGLLGDHIGRGWGFPVMDGEIGRAEPRIEPLRPEVCDFERVVGISRAYTFGNMPGEAMGERLGIMVSYNNERVHVENSCYGMSD